MTAARDLLGPAGPLARQMPGYELREGQLQMADAVERALGEGRVLFCEAGTGTGKTLAYLVPAILSGRKVVISTATRALQEQIYTKDLPLIQRVLGLEPRAALMKGLSNYLCLRRFDAFRSSAEAMRPQWARTLGTLELFRRETETGDVGELAGIAEDDPIWREVTSSSETRLGASCPHFDQCFVTRMRRDAEAAQLVIVNHHLFFADLALRGPHPGSVIPDYEAVIFDEAHQLEDVATDFFGVRISGARVERLLADAERTLGRAELTDPLLGGARTLSVLSGVQSALEALWRALDLQVGRGEPRVTLERDIWTGSLRDAWFALDSALEALEALADSSASRSDRTDVREALELAERRAEQLRADLAEIVSGAPGRVTFYDASGKKRALSSSPVDVSNVFRTRVFESVGSVVMTSATLTERTSFSYLRRRLGVEDAVIDVTELVVPSPFDFRTNALLYTPRDLPAPNDSRFSIAASDRISELVELSDGGAFVLTTSVRQMHALHRGLRDRMPARRILLQGQAPKGALISAFRAAGDAVLVATMSFWEGVDVPGDALRLVVLDKIPFLVPSDPLVRARSLEIEARGDSAFSSYHVPAAAITLKQGFGRLIRTRTDRGVVALLDERIVSRGYGKQLIASLPPARHTDSLEDVKSFWQEAPA